MTTRSMKCVSIRAGFVIIEILRLALLAQDDRVDDGCYIKIIQNE